MLVTRTALFCSLVVWKYWGAGLVLLGSGLVLLGAGLVLLGAGLALLVDGFGDEKRVKMTTIENASYNDY